MNVSEEFLVSLLDKKDRRKYKKIFLDYRKRREAFTLKCEKEDAADKGKKKEPDFLRSMKRMGRSGSVSNMIDQCMKRQSEFINECLVRYAIERSKK